MAERKIILDKNNGRLDTTKEKGSELEAVAIEATQIDTERIND